MTLRKTIWTVVSSYGHLGSAVLTTLVSVPLALQYLTKEEFGLWSFASQIVGYLLLLDLGVSSSIGRVMAEPLHRGHPQEISRWFTLNLMILGLQGLLLLCVGLLLAEPAVRWFEIPVELRDDATHLLYFLIVATALSHPFRLCNGILFAQNRAYLPNAIAAVSTWIHLLAFAAFLEGGFRSLAYGLATAALAVVQAGLGAWFVARGPHRFQLVRTPLFSAETRELFQFSSSLFFIGIAVQIVLMSQSLILTKALGLAAVASFNVCTKAPQMLLQLLWRPFDSFAPRWQQLYVSGDGASLGSEFQRVSRFTIAVTLFAIIGLISLNEWFVGYWAEPELYLGRSFDLLFGSYLLVHTVNHCLGYPFMLTRNTRALAGLALAEAACNILSCAWATPRWGVNGLMIASLLSTLLVNSGWIALNGPRQLRLALPEFLRSCRPLLPLLAGCALLAAVHLSSRSFHHPLVDLAISALGFAALAFCLRGDLEWVKGVLQRRKQTP
jgi:O-antigen/teichoic acid export membrane protein